jgi:hypothetical protein
MDATAAMTSHRATSLSGGMSRTSSTYHPYQTIFKNWNSASSQLWQPKNRDMLERVWTEMDNRIDVWRVTRGSHIECLQGNISKLESFPNYWCISRDCRLTGYFIINIWKCYLLLELPCIYGFLIPVADGCRCLNAQPFHIDPKDGSCNICRNAG